MIQRQIPGWYRVQRALLVATAIGVVIHELAHKEMVEDFGLQVREVCLFQLGDPSGYVVHDEPRGYVPTFAISIAPFLLNTAVAYTAFVGAGAFVSTHSIETLAYTELGAVIAVVWVGISAGLHAFPSHQDTRNIWEATKRRWWNPLAILGIPVIVLLVLLDKSKPFGSNFLFTGFVGLGSYQSLSFIFATSGI